MSDFSDVIDRICEEMWIPIGEVLTAYENPTKSKEIG